jgi:hypothetical protein
MKLDAIEIQNGVKFREYHYTTNRLLQRLFPQLAAVVQPLLLGALQSLTVVLLKTAANCLQRFLYTTAAK